MKTKYLLRHLTMVAMAAGLFLLTGCKTVSVSSFQYVGGPVYAPTNPAQIEVLRTPPVRPHVRLGEVTAEPSTDSVSVQKIEQALREAAAKMGADAVVIVSDRMLVTGAIVTGPWFGRTVQQTDSRVVVGVAIRYTGK